tara:strand:+ start:40460 stop:41350 length:891 start_codon:yes stop_codon:yes gene_type:complete
MSRRKNYKNFLEFSSDVFPEEKLLIDPFLGRYYRPFSLRLSWLFYRTNITPNFVTVLQIIIGLGACLSIALFPRQNVFIAGVIVLHLAYLLDNCDGEIARAKKMDSLEGVFLDKFAHAITMPSIFMAVSLYYCKFFIDYQFFILLISFLSGLCTFNPVNRLVSTIVQQLISKKQYSQYDLSRYKKNSKLTIENDDFQFDEDEYFIKPSKRNIKKVLKKKMLKFGKQFFRHVSYLFLITILLFLELFGLPLNIILILWLCILFSVITKEIYGLQLVMRKDLILKRYTRLLSQADISI